MSNSARDLTHLADTRITSYDTESHQKAYDLYINSNLGPTEIAVSLSLPREIIIAWIRRGAWRDRKIKIESELMQQSDDSYRSFLQRTRLPEAEAQVKAAGTLVQSVQEMLDDAKAKGKTLKPATLQMLSKTLAQAAGVSARAVGISDAAMQAVATPPGQAQDQGPRDGKKMPFVLVAVPTPTATVGAHQAAELGVGKQALDITDEVTVEEDVNDGNNGLGESRYNVTAKAADGAATPAKT